MATKTKSKKTTKVSKKASGKPAANKSASKPKASKPSKPVTKEPEVNRRKQPILIEKTLSELADIVGENGTVLVGRKFLVEVEMKKARTKAEKSVLGQ